MKTLIGMGFSVFLLCSGFAFGWSVKGQVDGAISGAKQSLSFGVWK